MEILRSTNYYTTVIFDIIIIKLLVHRFQYHETLKLIRTRQNSGTIILFNIIIKKHFLYTTDLVQSLLKVIL